MKKMPILFRATAAVLIAFCAASVPAADPADPLERATLIQKDVVDIRGLPFKKAVPMEKQTPAGLGRHMEKEMQDAVPPALAKHFDKIVRRVGLYRGPVIDDYRGMMRTVMESQVAAYYDPDTGRVYLLDEGGDALEQGVIYSHELYHALQDQYFDLNGYVSDKLKLDADQMLARVAVVEGEATYICMVWGIRQMTNGMTPPRALVGPVIAMQAGMDVAGLREMVGASAPGAQDMDKIPPFIIETLVGNYLKGAAFVFAVQGQGWPAVEKLYKEYPPQSTEQILHPEKWLAREGAAKFKWPDFGRERALRDWELIDEDVIGEIQWRIIFKVNGEQAEGAANAAGGWNGDRYAVFKRKGAEDTLLLLRTSWDSAAEAAQFVEAYRRALAVKYQGADEAVAVEQQGTEVFVVEGGRKDGLEALLKLVRQAQASRS
jgi:hypothetical protein